MIYLTLFWEFLKIGLFTIGGGLAALPYLFELAERYTWFTSEQVVDMIAIAESTPGPIGVNAATFAGYQAAGMLGGIIATLGFAVPGLIVSIIVAKFLATFHENRFVKASFLGLRPAVTGLILAVGIKLIIEVLLKEWSGELSTLISSVDIKAAILFIVSFFAILKFKKHPIVYIGAAAAIGIIFKF